MEIIEKFIDKEDESINKHINEFELFKIIKNN